MKKHKGVVLEVQIFCILLLIMSRYLEPSVAQIAYCITVFSSPFLLLTFGEQVLFSVESYWSSAAVFIAEFLLSIIFVGTMITGMKMDVDALRGFGTLLFVYCLAVVLSIAERVATRVKV